MYLRGEATLPAGCLPSSYLGFDGLAPEAVMLPVVEGGANLYSFISLLCGDALLFSKNGISPRQLYSSDGGRC